MGLSEGLLDSDLWPVVGFLFQGRSLAPPDRIAGTYGPKSPEHRDSGQHGEIRGVAGFAVPGCRTEFPMVTSSELRWGTGLSDKPSYAVVVAFRCVYMHCPFLTDVKTICIYIYTYAYIHTHIYIYGCMCIYTEREVYVCISALSATGVHQKPGSKSSTAADGDGGLHPSWNAKKAAKAEEKHPLPFSLRDLGLGFWGMPGFRVWGLGFRNVGGCSNSAKSNQISLSQIFLQVLGPSPAHCIEAQSYIDSRSAVAASSTNVLVAPLEVSYRYR